jgi:alpha-L-fucosidase 2
MDLAMLNVAYPACFFLFIFVEFSNALSLWATTPANGSDIIRTTYPLGNGRLGAMPFGPPGAETLTLNVDSLWSGGPFEASVSLHFVMSQPERMLTEHQNYTGGNPNASVASALPGIRDWIFTNGTGNVTELLGSDSLYGSYRVLGNLSVAIPYLQNSRISNYTRTLNLSSGVHTTTFGANGSNFETSAFCSYPDQVCVYTIRASTYLPMLEVRLDNELVDPQLQNVTCTDAKATELGHLRLRGVTQLGPPQGMYYDAIARVVSDPFVNTSCDSDTGTLKIFPGNVASTIAIFVGAGTNYDAIKGTAEYGYSFRGSEPGPAVELVTLAAAEKSLSSLKASHEADFTDLTNRFELTIPDHSNSSQIPTSELLARYNSNNTAGDPYLEKLLFDYAQYLFISSSRPGSLPPNLQGRWSEGLGAAWSGDYHANINLQMNHWVADQTGLSSLQAPLFDYMADTWVPRGSETAKLLYGAPGWVVHDEMNIFGHTGMKSDAQWANYPAAAAWMMQHVFDHWDYSQNSTWLRDQGYPLIKGVAEFWLSQLQEDEDGSLVVNPCNSPEHGPTTFGCAHYQQLVHQVFEAVLTAWKKVAEQDPEGPRTEVRKSFTDAAFLMDVENALERLDKGFHIGAWGQIKEWKLSSPSFDLAYEFENDTHRHLSELVGWFPGYSLSSFLGGYTNTTVQSAVRQKLVSRGIGNGPDANSGWEKVWRAACWARLNATSEAYFELRYAIEQNFAGNGLSMYSGTSTPFQIDANFGFAGAVLSMLVVDLPVVAGGATDGLNGNGVRTVVLGPAIPVCWGGGSVKGLQLRGGATVDFAWDGRGMVTSASMRGGKGVRLVNKVGDVLVYCR